MIVRADKHARCGDVYNLLARVRPQGFGPFSLYATNEFSEGAFNAWLVGNPPTADMHDGEGIADAPDLEMIVRLRAGDDSAIATIECDEKVLRTWEELRRHVMKILGDDRGPSSVAARMEAHIICDKRLHYQHLIDAITAVCEYRDNDRTIFLVENIRMGILKDRSP